MDDRTMQIALWDWLPDDCPEFDLSMHMNPPEE
jgi:hypothetical protein